MLYCGLDKIIIFCYLQDLNILLILDQNLNIQGKYLLDIYINHNIDDSILCDINIINNYNAELLFNKNGNFHTKILSICSKCYLSFMYEINHTLICNKCNSNDEN